MERTSKPGKASLEHDHNEYQKILNAIESLPCNFMASWCRQRSNSEFIFFQV